MKLNRTVYFLLGLLALCLALSYRMATPFFGPAVLAVLFAIGFNPLYSWLERVTHRPGTAAAIATLLVYLLVMLPLALTVALLADDVASQIAAVKTASQSEGGFGPLVMSKTHDVVAWIAPKLRIPEDYLMSQIGARAQAAAQAGLALTTGFLVGAGASIVDFVLASIMLFFLFRDGAKMREALLEFIPLSKEDGAELVTIVHHTITANLYGVVGVAIVQGLLTMIGLLIARVPSAFTWGAFAIMFAVLPVVGPTIVWVPAVIWLIAKDHIGAAIFLALWGIVVVGLSDNLIRPMLVSGRVHQHALLVFFSLLGGTAAFGILGLFLGPLLVSVTIAVFKFLRRELAT